MKRERRLMISMRYLVLMLLFCMPFAASAQLDSVNYYILKDYESKLKRYSDTLRNDPSEERRAAYNELFRKTLAEALENEQSFYYPFDSVKQTISFLNTDDGKARIITWVLVTGRSHFTNHGVIQYRQKKSVQTYWLRDKMPKEDSLFTDTDQDNWAGCLYYQGYTFKRRGVTMYCLLGYNGLDWNKNRKYIEILWFEKDGTLHFGAPVFYMSETDFTPQYRVMFEFAERANMDLRFEPSQKIIVFSHLVKSNKMAENIPEYQVPEGTYDYFKLEKKKGRWRRHEMLENFKFE